MSGEQHQMHLDKEHPSGFEEWYCPVCGRRLLMKWPPDYEKVVLQPGDEGALHSAGKGGLNFRSAQVTDEPEEEAEIPEEHLAPWIEGLKKLGL